MTYFLKTLVPVIFFLFATVCAAEPTDHTALKQSLALESKKNYESAIRSLAPVYNAGPKGFFVNLRLGWLNYLNGNYKNALTHYDKALAAERNSVNAYYGKINTLTAQKRWKEAEKTARSLCAQLPNDYTANLRLANLLISEKRYRAAVQVLQAILSFYPDTTELLNTLAYAQKMDGDEDGASRSLQKVLTMSPDNSIALGYVHELVKAKD